MPSTKSSAEPKPHPSFAVLEELAKQALDGTLKGNALLAAARLLCQDRWHTEKMALVEAKLALQEQKEARIVKQNRQQIRLKRTQFALKIKEYKLKKKAQVHKSADSREQEEPVTVSFAAVKPSEEMIRLKHELGIQTGGVVLDTRQGLNQTHTKDAFPPNASGP
jgi:hypothetical protein